MPEIIQQELTVSAEETGIRLDRFLSARFPVITRIQWQNRIKDGTVSVDGKKVRPSRKMKSGEQIRFSYTKSDEPPVNRNYSILFEDNELFIINKPPDLPVHPSGIYYKNTLHHILKEDYGEESSFRPVHRLDRETSGVLLLAKTREAAGLLQKDFQNGSVHKEYRVLVEGRFPEYADASGFLLADEKSEVRKKRKFEREKEKTSGGESARTEFYSEGFSGELSLLRAVLHTGRMHQIRATLCSMGFPVVGDRLYGIDDSLYIKFIEDRETDEDRKKLRMKRTALHCMKMEFIHPGTKKKMSVLSPLPDDFPDSSAFTKPEAPDA